MKDENQSVECSAKRIVQELEKSAILLLAECRAHVPLELRGRIDEYSGKISIGKKLADDFSYDCELMAENLEEKT